MPIYAYRCENCGHQHDALQKISDAPLTDCPACGQPALKKQLTAAGFQLKGSGWYVTDFRNGGSAGKAASSTAPSDAGGSDAKGGSSESGSSASASDSSSASTSSGAASAPSAPSSAPATSSSAAA